MKKLLSFDEQQPEVQEGLQAQKDMAKSTKNMQYVTFSHSRSSSVPTDRHDPPRSGLVSRNLLKRLSSTLWMNANKPAIFPKFSAYYRSFRVLVQRARVYFGQANPLIRLLSLSRISKTKTLSTVLYLEFEIGFSSEHSMNLSLLHLLGVLALFWLMTCISLLPYSRVLQHRLMPED